MAVEDPRINPNTAPVWGQEVDQPYARRSIFNIFMAIVLIIGFIYIILWWSSEPETNQNLDQRVVLEEQMPGNRYPDGSVRGGIYDLFYKIFGGIEDGLEDNPHNLNNVDHLDDFNLNQGNVVLKGKTPIKTVEPVEGTVVPKPEDGYKYSVYDIIGSKVQGVEVQNTGKVHDILIHKDTGKAKGIVLNDEGVYYDRDLKILKFKNVLHQTPEGEVEMMITEDIIKDRPEFDYQAVVNSEYISLRNLRDGQVLSHDGDFLGQIDAVIYQNAEAQSIYFKLQSSLFKIPYDAAKIIENSDGYDIQLTEKQTESLLISLKNNEGKN